jgi:hypothetical protein
MPGDNINIAGNGQIWNSVDCPWQWHTNNPPWKDPSIGWNSSTLPWKAGAASVSAGGDGMQFDDELNSQYLAVLDDF